MAACGWVPGKTLNTAHSVYDSCNSLGTHSCLGSLQNRDIPPHPSWSPMHEDSLYLVMCLV